MQNPTLRRNTIILNTFPPQSGAGVAYSKIVAGCFEHYNTQDVNNALADLSGHGYITQADNGWMRTQDSRSLSRKKAAQS